MMRVLLRRTDHPIALGYVLIACHKLMRCSAAAAWLASMARTSDGRGSLCSDIGPFSRVSDRSFPAMLCGSCVENVDELSSARFCEMLEMIGYLYVVVIRTGMF